jgi:hypothetical protein
LSIALNFNSLILPLVIFTALLFKKTVLIKLQKLCGRQRSKCVQQSIEEHPPTPCTSQLEYVSGK